MNDEITPEHIADPANADALRERARNTSNVNPSPTTKTPVKSQAIDGPTPDPRAQQLHQAGQATVDPAPPPPVPADHGSAPEDGLPGGDSRDDAGGAPPPL